MNTVIILAAGKGLRMKAEVNKQYLVLKDKPIIAHTIEAFQNSFLIDEIILVINQNEQELFKNKILTPFSFDKVSMIVGGGVERQHSVYHGLSVIHDKTDIVLIHDGARPLITSDIIERCIEGAKQYGAVSAGVPIKETIKIVAKEGFVQYTPKREDVWVTQTPQAFQVDIIKQAHEFAKKQGLLGTDDAMLVEYMGKKIKMVQGDYENIKITTPEDLIAAEGILNYRRKIQEEN